MNVEQLKKAISEAFEKAAEEAAEKILEECPRKEIKEDLEPWEPKEEDVYYYVGTGVDHTTWADDEYDQRALSIGNIFRTEEEAEKAVEWLKARKVLFDDAKGFKPDWRNTEQFKWSVYYVPGEDEDEDEDKEGLYSTNINTAVNDIPGPYFATREDAEKSIKAHKKEWKIYLGVEE